MRKTIRRIAAVFICAVMPILVFFPERYVPAALEGIKLWALCVLPSLFPFFFLTLLLTKNYCVERLARAFDRPSKLLFRCGGVSVYVFFMSVLSGYPVGARLIGELREKGVIGKDEATRMSALCSTSGPLFIVGSVGTGMLGDKSIGLIMLVCHILSAFLCGICFRFYGKSDRACPHAEPLIARIRPDNVLYESVYGAVISILCVGGFICLFYTLSEILADFKILLPLEYLFNALLAPLGVENIGKAFAAGLIECTRGCGMLSQSASASAVAAPCCALISFGGVSVIFQSAVYLSKAGADMRMFLLSKTLQTLFSFVLCLVAVKLFIA